MAVYAITGGAGFIGSHLADDLLADGHDVRVLDDLSTGQRGRLDARAGLIVDDVADPAALARLLDGAEAVFHLAAIASVVRANEDWTGCHRVNQGGTVAVLQAARRAGGIPVVYASSAAVYGNRAGPGARGPACRAAQCLRRRQARLGAACRHRFQRAWRAHHRLALLQHLRPAPGPALALFRA